MKKLLLSLFVAIAVLSIPSVLWANGSRNVKTAREVVKHLSMGQYHQVRFRFDERMKNALPASRLSDAWMALTGRVGKFEKEVGTTTFDYNGYEIVVVTCRFEKSFIDVRVVFDKKDRIAGLFFLPHRGAVSGGRQRQQRTAPLNRRK